MTYNAPSKAEWQRLYELSHAVKELAPWEWMEEDEVFGLKDPETGELHLVSIMGTLGEHFATAVYLGNKGLHGFLDMQRFPAGLSAQRLLEIPQLHASYENRDQVQREDREVMKMLGHKYRGRYAWPLFRSYRPGYVPWLIESHEARLLAHALEQVRLMAPRVRQDPELLQREDEDKLLVRVPHKQHGQLTWRDKKMSVPPPETVRYMSRVDGEALESLAQAQHVLEAVEIDVSLLPVHVGKRGERPVIPYLLLVADAQSGMILANDMLQADPTLKEMWSSVPGVIVDTLAELDLRPEVVRASEPLLLGLLQPLQEELGIEIEAREELPAVEAARQGLEKHLERG